MGADESRLTPEQIAAELAAFPGWSLADGALRRTYETDGWRGSLLVANAIGFLCEAADHHAELLVSWPRVSVALSTHSAGGVTRKDLEVARLIEAQVAWRPPPGSSLTGPAKPFVR
jgi:pterin-4a-carbinolamine dehydratase